jgi:hypothetical protein
MISAGYISHVCGEHIFDLTQEQKTLFFTFCLQEKEIGSSLLINEHAPLVSTARIHATHGDDLESNSIMSLLADLPHDRPTTAKKALSKQKKHQDYALMTEEVDIGLLSMARNLQADFQFLKQIKDRVWHLQICKKSFSHDDAMEWMARQVRIQHGFYRVEQRRQKQAEDAPLSLDHAQEVAARLGEAMVCLGYIASCVHPAKEQTFHANCQHATFLKFHEEVVQHDAQRSGLARLSEHEVDAIVSKFVKQEIQHSDFGSIDEVE